MAVRKIKKLVRLDPVDSVDSALAAHLRYVDDTGPGFLRVRHGKGVRFLDLRGQTLRDPVHLERIRHLAIPPAWTTVWICARADGHIQATGRDARGRKQYRYHARFREVRDETKYERMIAFADVLPRIRAAVDEQLKSPKLTREKILAAMVRLKTAKRTPSSRPTSTPTCAISRAGTSRPRTFAPGPARCSRPTSSAHSRSPRRRPRRRRTSPRRSSGSRGASGTRRLSAVNATSTRPFSRPTSTVSSSACSRHESKRHRAPSRTSSRRKRRRCWS